MKTEGVADENTLTREIIGAAIGVNRFFGPGLLLNFNVERLVDRVERVSL